MPRTLGLIGVPSSAGAHSPGQEKAPAALRGAGLGERLEAVGLRVVDRGDLPRVRWRPDRAHPRRQNLGIVVDVARGVAERVEQSLGGGETPLVIGGDCTVELGVLAGALSHGEEVGLLYFDAHPDLNTPDSVAYGALDWMGMAHALGEPGAIEELSRVGPRFPLLTDDRVFFFGYVPHELTEHEREAFGRRGLLGVPVGCVAGRAEDAAAEALAEVEGWPGGSSFTWMWM